MTISPIVPALAAGGAAEGSGLPGTEGLFAGLLGLPVPPGAAAPQAGDHLETDPGLMGAEDDAAAEEVLPAPDLAPDAQRADAATATGQPAPTGEPAAGSEPAAAAILGVAQILAAAQIVPAVPALAAMLAGGTAPAPADWPVAPPAAPAANVSADAPLDQDVVPTKGGGAQPLTEPASPVAAAPSAAATTPTVPAAPPTSVDAAGLGALTSPRTVAADPTMEPRFAGPATAALDPTLVDEPGTEQPLTPVRPLAGSAFPGDRILRGGPVRDRVTGAASASVVPGIAEVTVAPPGAFAAPGGGLVTHLQAGAPAGPLLQRAAEPLLATPLVPDLSIPGLQLSPSAQARAFGLSTAATHSSTADGEPPTTPATEPAGSGPVAPAAGTTGITSMPVASVATAGPVANQSAATPPGQITAQVFPEVTAMAHRGDGSHRLTIRLTPEALGDVRVVLTVRKGDIHVRMTGSDAAQQVLRAGAPELHRLLDLAGATSIQVVVGEQTTAFDARPQQQGNGAATDHRTAGTRDGDTSARDGENGGPHTRTSTDPATSLGGFTRTPLSGVDVTM